MATAKRDLTDTQVQGHHDQLLTVEQVAERLNVSVTYVRRRLIFERRIPYIKLGSKVRVEASAVTEFIDNGRVTPQDYRGLEQPFVPRIAGKRRR